MGAVNWAFLCDYAFLANGKGSMIGMFDTINTKILPYVVPQLFVVASLTITPNDGLVKLGIHISSPSGITINSVNQPPISAHGGTIKHNTIANFQSLLLSEAGEYHIEIFINGQSVHLLPLPVILIH